jgi:hypothetical protein
MRRSEVLLILAWLAVPGSSNARAQRAQLDPRIGPPVRGQYEAIQDAKDWLNPYLIVCADGVRIVALHKTSFAPIRNVRTALVKLPIDVWPYGRVIAIQDCGIVTPSDRDRGERVAEVEALLSPLKLTIKKWSS